MPFDLYYGRNFVFWIYNRFIGELHFTLTGVQIDESSLNLAVLHVEYVGLLPCASQYEVDMVSFIIFEVLNCNAEGWAKS